MSFESLRSDLAGYTLAAVGGVLGSHAMAAVTREQRVPALVAARRACVGEYERRMDPGTQHVTDDAGIRRVALLARLFLLGDTLTRAEIAEVLPDVSAADELSLVVEESLPHTNGEACERGDICSLPEFDSGKAAPGTYRARFQIVPVAVPAHLPVNVRDVLIASDWGELAGVTPSENHVMPVGGATKTLASLAGYSAGQRVLDVGTGCGIHAILAALCGAAVTATDVSARALDYARLNAKLAGIDVVDEPEPGSITFREGSLLEPASGEYDVVVSNPPFVITPASVRESRAYEYRDGGREGDSLIAELVEGLPQVLADEGRAWLLGNWEIYGAWMAGPAAWIGSELDAWIIQREELTPAEYVEMWLRDGGLTPRDTAYERMYSEWLADFEEREVDAIGMGYLCLGKPAASLTRTPFRRFERLSGPAPISLYEYTEKIWQMRPLLSNDDALLASHVRASGLEHRLHMPGQPDPFMIKLAQLDGFAEEIQVTSAVAAVVSACDGELSLGVLCDAVAQLTEQSPADVRAEVLPAAAELLALGILNDAGAERSQ